MIEQKLRLLDTEAIAVHYGVAPGTVRSWASRYRWSAYGSVRNRLWSLTEAQSTVDKLDTSRVKLVAVEQV